MEASGEAVQATAGAKKDETEAEGPNRLGCDGRDAGDAGDAATGGDDDKGDDDDLDSLFGSPEDEDNTDNNSNTTTTTSGETSLASPTSATTLLLPLPLPKAAPTPTTLPLPSPVLPVSSAVAVPADSNCDVSTTLPESDHEVVVEEKGGKEKEQRPAQQHTITKDGQHDTLLYPDADPSGFDMNVDLGDIEFDFNIDMSSFVACSTGMDAVGGGDISTGAAEQQQQQQTDACIDFDFRLGVDAELELARELGLELGAPQQAGTTQATQAMQAMQGPQDMPVDTCFFDAAGLAGSTIGAFTAHTPSSVSGASTSTSMNAAVAADHHQHGRHGGQRLQDCLDLMQLDLDLDLERGPSSFQDALLLAEQAADQAAGAAGAAAAMTPMATPTTDTIDTASDDVVVLYERPAVGRAEPTASHQSSTATTAAQPCVQLLSPASEPLSQSSSRHASEEASSPAPPAVLAAANSVTPAVPPVPTIPTVPTARTTPPPVVPASLQASIPHYLELRPRCPQIPPPKRIDLGKFNVEELLPYVQLHSKLSMGGIQQMLGLDVDAGRLVVGECRRYLADPAHKVAPSGSSDPTALRMLKVALIQSSLVLLKYGESGVHNPQRLENGVGERWFSRSSTLEPKSMHVWPDDSTTLVLLFIQLLYRLTRNNSVRERQRKASALRRAMNSPPRSPSPSDATGTRPKTTATGSDTARSRAKKPRSAPRSAREAPAAKRPRLSQSDDYHLLPSATTTPALSTAAATTATTATTTTTTTPTTAAKPLQPILAYNSPRVLRDDLIMYASRKPPPTANIRYIVNVVDRSAQRMIPQVVLGHDGPIRSAGYSYLAQRCACMLGDQHEATISIMTLLGLEKVSSDADWDRVVCRVYGDVLMDREVRVLISVGEK